MIAPLPVPAPPAPMSPDDEDALERFVRFPATLSAAERVRVADLLRGSAAARELAAFFRSFYEVLDELDGDPAPDANDGPAPDAPQ